VRHRFIALTVFASSFVYYGLLSAREYTWVFASGDSGDWLASANMWFVPQAFGSPLYIALAKIPGALPFNLPITMALVLSAIPAAVTVMLVYLIVWQLTNRALLAITSAVVLLGCGVFLTQATIVEEYCLSVMFVVAAFYFYINDRKYMTALFLGLGTAVHIVVLPIAVLWFFVSYREWRGWIKAMPIYIVAGILPYGLIVWLMASDAPRLYAGGLSWGAVNNYLGGTEVVGTLSLTETPMRLLALVCILLFSLGIAWLSIMRGFRLADKRIALVVLPTVAFPMWYYITCLHPSTWTYLAWAMPFLAVMAGFGLLWERRLIVNVVLAGAILFVVANSYYLNADLISKRDPQALAYFENIMALPNGSAVVCDRYGWRGFAVYYAISEGKEITPIFRDPDTPSDLYSNYIDWVHEKYGLSGSNAKELIEDATEKGLDVYVLE